MQTILFIILPYQSHYLPTFSLAHKLKQEGLKVVYTGMPHLKVKDLVEKEGFTYEYLPYTEEYNIHSLKIFLGLLLKSLFDKNSLKQNYKEFYLSAKSVQVLLEKHKPSVVFIDDNIAHYYLFAKNHTENIVLLNTRFFARKAENILPLNSSFIPTPTLFSKIYCECLWLKHLHIQKFKNWVEKIAFLGNSEEFYLKRYCYKNKIDWNNTVESQCSFFMNIKNVPSIILSPPYLEFSNKPNSEQDYYLFLKTSKDESRYFTEEYHLLINKIKKLNDRKILYCSFGTLALLYPERISSFLLKLINIVKEKSELELVISTGDLEINLPKYHHIHLFKYLPQVDMLQYTDLIITHSGTGTIRECVQMGVPMLAYPLDRKADHAGNAARVVANGFGLRGDMEKDSEAEIMRKINILLKQPFKKHREVDSEEKVIEILGKLGISLSSKVLS